LNTAREGGSTLRVGSYLVTLGGVSPSGYPVPSVEIFDSRRADKGEGFNAIHKRTSIENGQCEENKNFSFSLIKFNVKK